jgi:pheromone a factor receptor
LLNFTAGLLTYRLHCYRKEFHRLIAARNTTKSRFMRLFVMALILILFYLPWVFYNMYTLIAQIVDTYSWSRVHGPDWNSVIKVPGNGVVRTDKWSVIATGYVAFFVFGTGSDANNTYKHMLCAIGLGNIFPSLYNMSQSGSSTPSNVTFAKGWCSSMSTKAKSLFSRTDSVTETLPTGADSRNNSVAFISTPTTAHNESFHLISTTDPIVKSLTSEPHTSNKSFLARIFPRYNRQHSILPLFSSTSVDEINQFEKSPVDTNPTHFFARAWSSENPTMTRAEVTQGVHVVREVHQEQHEKTVKEKANEKQLDDAWA